MSEYHPHIKDISTTHLSLERDTAKDCEVLFYGVDYYTTSKKELFEKKSS